MGRVLFYCNQRFFCRVKGIEYDRKIFEKLLDNEEFYHVRFGGQREKFTLLNMKAEEYEIKPEDSCFYFFNPFTDRIMRRVMGQIRNQCRGREILLIYYHPRYPGAIEESGCFQLRQILYDPEKNYEVYVYSGKIPE